eukprot:TRINITY_DN9715_c0_g1_i2.p1 TRINITY_DN9715_c0_g1~~TRINITY_DN9715_c0_g1_i2.p1  ORF type:complete len:136 (+),score=31.13 TRINITY_DN9715_c0_g1_i2:217-624(+)
MCDIRFRFRLSKDGGDYLALKQRDHIQGPFPGQYRRKPKAVAETIASSGFVRRDLTEEQQNEFRRSLAVRKLLAIDMEMYYFYKALQDNDASIRKLAVKGVCDFGNMMKDDQFHEVAANNAASFVLTFVQQCVDF